MAVLENGFWNDSKEESDLSNVNGLDGNIRAENNKYHLYISYACPFAHRPFLVINYLGLNDAITVSSVAEQRYDKGWEFDERYPDTINDKNLLSEIVIKAKPNYSGKVTVPILWDKQYNDIITMDSSDIAINLATEWGEFATNKVDLVPADLKHKIIEMNEWLHSSINRKVYQAGFATNQNAYNGAVEEFFNAMEKMDNRLNGSKYLFGDNITLSDLFLLPSLVRFESVYAIHFKASKKPLKEFSNVYKYLTDLTSIESIKNTINIEHSVNHYYKTHRHINPNGIVPLIPKLEWMVS